MRERVERQPVAGTVAERDEAQRWTVDTVLALEERLRENEERFVTRGRIILRCRKIVNTFTNAELAMRSLQLLLDGVDVSEE